MRYSVNCRLQISFNLGEKFIYIFDNCIWVRNSLKMGETLIWWQIYLQSKIAKVFSECLKIVQINSNTVSHGNNTHLFTLCMLSFDNRSIWTSWKIPYGRVQNFWKVGRKYNSGNSFFQVYYIQISLIISKENEKLVAKCTAII